MKKILVSFAIFLATTTVQAASIGSWKAYLSYTNITEIEKVGNELFVLASKNLYLYNTQDNSVRTFSKMDALSDCSIAHIAWNQKARKLVVIYENKNIDLLEPNGNCTNMPEYYMKSMTGDKTINDVYVDDQYVYLSTGFGILKINVSKAEISDTYQLGFGVDYTYIENGKIFAASKTNGLYSANMNNNLLDKSNWVYAGPFADRQKTLDPELLDMVKNANPDGPHDANIAFMTIVNDVLYTSNGFTLPEGVIQTMKDDDWSVLDTKKIPETTGLTFPGVVALDIDPLDDKRLVAATRNGIYEFQDGQLANFYNHRNSPIEIFDGVHDEYELVTGVKFDQEGNMWCLNSQAPTQGIIKMDRQGKWTSYYHEELMKLNDGGFNNKSLGMLKGIIIDSKKRLWFVNDHWYISSLYCYDPATDKLDAYAKITNQDGTPYAQEYMRSVAEDRSGSIRTPVKCETGHEIH